ncbi:hypothetical protein B0T21DRAFT_306590 [Apiosordaria backusii]|uniref:C2H2-type domain-containing protein n=1 Tax=Apiosordaria backusii TaxID=314023 RepID=A0AA40EMP1_9PEZI|nr:hypothetical protein B0T21DRAFT_306590 [Apiosordaria backusii]
MPSTGAAMSAFPEPSLEESLSGLAKQCLEGLDRLEEALPEDHPNAVATHNARGRFNIWGLNMGAFRNSSSKASIDWRLRKAPTMRKVIYGTLKDLDHSLMQARLTIDDGHSTTALPFRGEKPDKQGDDLVVLLGDIDQTDPENQDLITFLSSPTTELDELFLSIQANVDRLFNLERLIRQRSRYQSTNTVPLSSAPLPGDDPSFDNHMVHLKDMFPKTSRQPWLQEKLGQAFSQRRNLILKKQMKTPRQMEVTEIDLPESQSSVAATTVEDISIHTSLEKTDIYASRSIHSGATSFASALSEGDSGELEVPDLTRFVVRGIRLQYDDPFNCPYCGRSESVGTEHEWRRHVFDDLQPYICTFRGCSSGLFSTRHEWFNHELELHRTQWNCHLCSSKLHSRDLLFQHLENKHQRPISHYQISNILALARPVREFPAGSCPFCDNWMSTGDIKEDSLAFCKHLGRHLQQLALDAVPLSLEGVEILPLDVPTPPPLEELNDTSQTEELNEAELLIELEKNKSEVGEEHPKTLTSMMNLALVFRYQGQLEEAGSLLRQSLEICSRILGPEHPNTVTCMVKLAILWRDQGQPSKAEVLAVEVLHIRRTVLGPEHPYTLGSMVLLAEIWMDLGRLEEALELMNDCVRLKQEVLGPDHPDVIQSKRLREDISNRREEQRRSFEVS